MQLPGLNNFSIALWETYYIYTVVWSANLLLNFGRPMSLAHPHI
jgi:hypothetical protein